MWIHSKNHCLCMDVMHSYCCLVTKSCLTLLRPHELKPVRLLCPWDFPGKNTWVGCHFLLRGISPPRDQTHIPCVSCIGRRILYHWASKEAYIIHERKVKVKLLSRVWLFATPWTVAYQAPPSMGFSRQEYWSGLPFPTPGDLPDPGIKPGSPEL